MEQEARLSFISTIDDPEEVARRLSDWDNAQFYRNVEKQKERLDTQGIGPTEEEWHQLTENYNRIAEKYRGKGELSQRNQWAIATRHNGKTPVKAFSVRTMIETSYPRLASDKHILREAWMDQWNRLNGFVHITPRSIFLSESTPAPYVIANLPKCSGCR